MQSKRRRIWVADHFRMRLESACGSGMTLNRCLTSSRKYLDPAGCDAFRDRAEVLVVFGAQGLQMFRLLEFLEYLLARKLVHGHVLVLVLAGDAAIAPAAHGAVVLQDLRNVLLVVPLVESSLL